MRGRFLSLALVLVGCCVAGACREEGAGEKAGRKLDEVVEKLQHPKEGPLEKLGRETDEALEDAKRAIEDARERD